MIPRRRSFRLPGAAALAAILAASASAQVRGLAVEAIAPAPTPLAPALAPSASALGAPAGLGALAAPAAPTPLGPVLAAPAARPAAALPAAPAAAASADFAAAPAAASAVPAAALSAMPGAASGEPARPSARLSLSGLANWTGGARFDGAAEPSAQPLAEPALTQALHQSAGRVWAQLPHAGAERTAFGRALEAADYTGAREILFRLERAERARLGADFGRSFLAAELTRLERALDLPDHPVVAQARAALRDARALRAEKRDADAMHRLDDALRAIAESPLAGLEQRWVLRSPLISAQVELHKRAIDVESDPVESRRERLFLDAAGVRAWLLRARREDPARVAGDFDGQKIAVQRWSDCALQSLWNLPALRSLRDGRTYARFVAEAERILGQPVRATGLRDGDSRTLLHALGWERTYDASPKGEAWLVSRIAENGGVLGSIDFDMTRWQALIMTGTLNQKFNHAVAVPAAVFDRGHWWFVVLDSNYREPRLLTYGELLTLNFKAAAVSRLAAPALPRAS